MCEKNLIVILILGVANALFHLRLYRSANTVGGSEIYFILLIKPDCG
jgi:hypothetical protein